MLQNKSRVLYMLYPFTQVQSSIRWSTCAVRVRLLDTLPSLTSRLSLFISEAGANLRTCRRLPECIRSPGLKPVSCRLSYRQASLRNKMGTDSRCDIQVWVKYPGRMSGLAEPVIGAKQPVDPWGRGWPNLMGLRSGLLVLLGFCLYN